VSTGNDDLQAWQHQRTTTLACELADSGRYEDFTDVAYALQFEHGLPSAQALIDDADTRRALNRRCGIACEARALVEAERIAASLAAEHARRQAEAEAAYLAANPAESTDPAPSWLRRATMALSRHGSRTIKPVGAGDLNSAPS
jgi:hypothetical protein